MTLDVAHLPVREQVAEFGPAVLAVAHRIEKCLAHPPPVLRVHVLKRIGADHGLVISEQPAEGGICVDPAPFPVEQRDQVGSAFGDQAEPLFGFTQVLGHLCGDFQGLAARMRQGVKHAAEQQAR